MTLVDLVVIEPDNMVDNMVYKTCTHAYTPLILAVKVTKKSQ